MVPGYVIHNLLYRHLAQIDIAQKIRGTGPSRKAKLLTEGRSSAFGGNISASKLQAELCRQCKYTYGPFDDNAVRD